MRLQLNQSCRTRSKLALCLVFCTLFTLLTACGNRAAAPNGNPAAAQSGQDIQSAQGTQTAPAGALHMLEGQTAELWGNHSAQIYLPLWQENNVIVASAISFSDGVQRVVCTVDGCAHNSESCGGYLYTQTVSSVPMVLFWASDTQLFWVVSGSFNQSSNDYLDVSAPDGSNRRRLSLVPQDIPENYFPTYRGVCANDTHLYYIISRPNNCSELISTEIGTGAQKILASWGQDAFTWLVDCDGESLVVQQTGPAQEPEAPQTEDAQAWNEYKEAVGAAEGQAQVSLLQINLQGETKELKTWKHGDFEAFIVQDMVRYGVRSDDGAITAYDLRTGEERVVTTEIPRMKTMYLPAVYGGNLLVDPGTPNENPSKDDFRRYAVDLKTGATRQLTTKSMKEASARPLFILGGNDEKLLVVMENRYGTAISPGTDGTPYEHPTVEQICAVIPTQDYLSDTPNFTEVTFLPNGRLF